MKRRPRLQEDAQMGYIDCVRVARPFGEYAAAGGPRGHVTNLELQRLFSS